MKNLILAFFAISLATLGLTACRRNRVTYIETSQLVEQAGAKKGDLLIFPVPSGSRDAKGKPSFYVQFAKDASPCAGEKIPSKHGKPPQCTVTVNPPRASRFYFSIGSDTSSKKDALIADALTTSTSGKCPPWYCSGAVVVGSGSSPLEAPVPTPKSGSPVAAHEVLIYFKDNGLPSADPITKVFPGDRITWYKNGIDSTGWTVTFPDGVCDGTPPITSVNGEVEYCTLKAVPNDYFYTLTVDGKSTPDLKLTVSSPPAAPNAK